MSNLIAADGPGRAVFDRVTYDYSYQTMDRTIRTEIAPKSQTINPLASALYATTDRQKRHVIIQGNIRSLLPLGLGQYRKN